MWAAAIQISRVLINTVPSFMLPDMIKGKRWKNNFNKIYIKVYIFFWQLMSFTLDLIQISLLTSTKMLIILWGSKTVNLGDMQTHTQDLPKDALSRLDQKNGEEWG